METIALERVHNLFASPLMIFQIRDAETLNRQLAAESHAMRSQTAGMQRSNNKGWHSPDDFFRRTEPGCMTLRSHILRAVQEATRRVAPNFDFASHVLEAEGWININGLGGYNAPHDHPGYAWSGCYYVVVPHKKEGRGGSIEFLDPRTNSTVLAVSGADCFASKCTLDPQSGLLLIFPSYLKHWVYPNEQDSDRISIAFNVRFLQRTRESRSEERRVGKEC